ncbi:hypothetical protein [Streptomyces sp. NBC_01465]|uniref:hypothetical protein n=1 Tax=Streptomyces sp. NBC_01465 TaxID=2903878 RepID=UPI002E359DAE|nr:hypothetical protein [Streptomyces sp. NBC_01465]
MPHHVHVLLDFVHVAEYVWAAPHCFQKVGTPKAEAWVAGHLTTVLRGQADRAATEIMADVWRVGSVNQQLLHDVRDLALTWVEVVDSPDRMDAAVHALTEPADPDQLDTGVSLALS